MDNQEKLAAKKKELADVKEKMFALSPESEKAIERKLGILEGIALQKAHIGDTGLHISTVEKGEILENVKHRLDFHLSEKAIENTSIMVNLNTDHRGDSTLHFDSQKQKDDILNVLSNPQIVSTGGGAGVASFFALTDTPSAMGTENQILEVTAEGELAFTSNPTFATVSSLSHIVSSTGNINALAGSSTIYGNITCEDGDIRAEQGYIQGKHMASNGYAGYSFGPITADGYDLYFYDGLLTQIYPV